MVAKRAAPMVLRNSPFRGELGGRLAPTSTAVPLGAMLGHHHHRIGHVKDLPDRFTNSFAASEGPAAATTTRRPVHHHPVGIGHLAQRVPGRSGLFALPATHRPASRPIRVLGPVRLHEARITRRRLRGVRRVLAQPLLQIRHLAHQQRHLLIQLRHPRPQHHVLRFQLNDPGPCIHTTSLQPHTRTVVNDRAFRAITPDRLPTDSPS